MNMNQALAEHYGTNGVKTAGAPPSTQDIEKQAQYELFCKLASDNGIDLSKLSEAQIEELYTKTFSKEAGEMPPQFAAHKKDGKEGKEELEEKAKKEHEEKKAQAEKLAEADFMGRAMAHAYVQELDAIMSDRQSKTASPTAQPAPAAPENNGAWKVELPKVASAIDTLAMHRSFDIVKEFNKTAAADAKIDEKQAAEKIAAVHTVGLKESQKLASAKDHRAAVEIRALETLEAAGYPVNWA